MPIQFIVIDIESGKKAEVEISDETAGGIIRATRERQAHMDIPMNRVQSTELNEFNKKIGELIIAPVDDKVFYYDT